MTNSNKYAIGFCIGSNYWPHVATAIKSIFDTASSPVPDLHIFYESHNRSWQQKVSAISSLAKAKVSFRKFDLSQVKSFKHCGHLGLSTYFRIFLPEILSEYDRILYLDSDLLVLSDLSDLLNMDMGNHDLAARPVLWKTVLKDMSKGIKRGPEIPYFNAGVLLIDTGKWIKNRRTENLIRIITGEPHLLTYADQDALNLAVNGQFKELPSHWNVTSAYLETFPESEIERERMPEVISAARSPRIVHYTGPIKPWHIDCTHPLKDLYISTRQSLHKHPYKLMIKARKEIARLAKKVNSFPQKACH